ncbi:MAG: DUF2269 family protein [Gaiellaceae bacterium]
MDTPANTAPVEERSSGALTYALLAIVLVVAAIFVVESSSLPNNWYAAFKIIHVGFAVVWVGGGALLTILALAAERSKDPVELAGIARIGAFVGEKVFAPAGLIVFLMGIAMMLNTDWGWGHFWVIAGLIGYASTFVTGIAVLSPRAKQINASVAANGPTHPETIALIRQIMLIMRVDMAVLLLVIADMVLKPFA